jgi:hypothetical protein
VAESRTGATTVTGLGDDGFDERWVFDKCESIVGGAWPGAFGRPDKCEREAAARRVDGGVGESERDGLSGVVPRPAADRDDRYRAVAPGSDTSQAGTVFGPRSVMNSA